MKIGKKLLIGFGVPVVLTVIIMVLVLLTNSLTIGNVGLVGEQTDIWNLAQQVKTNFDEARTSAISTYYSYSDDNYNSVKKSLSDASTYVTDTINYINENPDLADFADEAQNADKAVKDYDSEFENMVTALKNAQAAVTAAAAGGTALSQNLDTILSRQVELVSQDFSTVINGGTADTDRRVANLTSANSVYAAIATARVAARDTLSSYTEDNGKKAQDAIKTASDLLNQYADAVTDPTNKTAVATVVSDLAEYSKNIDDYIAAQGQSSQAVTAFSAAAEDAAKYINVLQDQNDAVNASIKETSNLSTAALIIVSAIVLITLVGTVIVSRMVTKSISEPISYITKILGLIGGRGQTSFKEDEWNKLRYYASANDEAGECARNLDTLASALTGVAGLLETIASGNLNIKHTAMSEDDVISNSIIVMLDSLNSMFGEINGASTQVTLGASQISDASQSLAEGSTEQAATVEELSASIQDIAAKTKLNADRAANASELSGVIKGNAETGSQQMTEMTEAVNEINSASQDISKVIKVIDDIAFQTNILALNAAVEAARAGEAGKGFAVVADEVRNLASKSAAAAKETGQLIENAMRKSDQGAAIAAQTAISLTEIVDGINRSATLIAEIAESSDEQSGAINQINVGISQVSEVVQKNSATAEECAASAQELNAQSTLMAEYVAKFKLRV
jgi:methyl-accepting chemotaxis protein